MEYLIESFDGWHEIATSREFTRSTMGIDDEFMGNIETRSSYVNHMDCQDFSEYPVKVAWIHEHWVSFTKVEIDAIKSNFPEYKTYLSDNSLPISVRGNRTLILPSRIFPNTPPIEYNPPNACLYMKRAKDQVVIIKLSDFYYVAKYKGTLERFFKCGRIHGRRGVLSLIEFDPFK